MGTPVDVVVAAASRESHTRIVATLIRVTGDWDLAEDCAQEALALALERWPAEGVPNNPGGWLMTVARNRAIDALRRANLERRKLSELASLPLDPPAPAHDDRLRLIFTCCHPALSLEARVALTLRTVAGMPAADIARAFLVTESTMTRRLTRAKDKIAQARIPYRVPSGPALNERLPSVFAVLYLLFSRGYDADGEPAFADEAIRLTRLLAQLMSDSEVDGLLALFLLQHSRRAARRDADGNLLTLAEQDRARWDLDAITEALRILPSTDGPYALQASIAACHVAEKTDWTRIAALYDRLATVVPSPVVLLNRAVAYGYAQSPATGLAMLESARVGGGLDGYPLALAAEADMTARAGDRWRAVSLYEQAAAVAPSPAEQRALLRRATELSRN
ncbi:RNA polymerase sigma factor [Winogradskya humida]|uniref:RNA polymerase subunit sigma-24 n=1 Tax=Winogradskya humida TaxID=113566 RepID=A0ABQ3ZLD7_9ACTN|nr:sigma-70 family RNA polymerase sigma factor [Actinoplanes humidus]GIE19404.1 RNA polymerase subunit sigma-24 [Actinoplanes humidus]